MKDLQDNYRGTLLGLALGDALGTTVEFRPPGSFEPLTDLTGGGPFHLQAGQWTDDTSMAICLAESLIACRGNDLTDQCQRYLDWWHQGTNSATGSCFDIGNTVRSALATFQATGNPQSGSRDPQNAGNGSLMRLAPAALYYACRPRHECLQRCEESSLTTHGADETLWACRLFGNWIVQALTATDKKDALSLEAGLLTRADYAGPLSDALQAVVAGSYRHHEPPRIRGTGYVVHSLEAALWAFWRAKDFRHGALLAANLGDDADTTAAIYGQLAGAFWGGDALPPDWQAKLHWREKLSTLAETLHQLATKASSPPSLP
ncbi:ADP-ribosylglycohydrolase family protein [Roseibacillus ishigakijimensis]|uniref:ADP-ribosylglycohydrolase family protein n=1 Tax=Roseibacillus ishigakijimensis TaxID=454146 RepID=A0A934RRI1_9BACT|nr:ADP-ribosylglycohydrolase family protein [Roseibacillus ishigakijimensis]MBK1834582.1 ADP-ribosylglycohydrolase family protein [Roseibacillus ishigakijimensis]